MESKILIYGAGVIGSIFAGKLLRSGIDVTILARGNRYDEITSQGLILQNAMNDKVETYKIDCIKELDENDLYDFIIVAVQNTQVDSILPVLKDNKSKNIIFVINNPLGYEKYISAVGRERVIIGFPSAGGERKNGIVTYFVGRGLARIIQSTIFGEIDGKNTQRLQTITKIFRNAGFDPANSKDMDAWQKTHVAFVVPIARALYKFESNNYKLARSRNVIRKMILATREGFKAIDDAGIEIEPKKLSYYYHLPTWLLVTLYQIVFNTKIAEYAMAKHTLVAMEEINAIDDRFRNMYKTSIFTNWDDLRQLTAATG